MEAVGAMVRLMLLLLLQLQYCLYEFQESTWTHGCVSYKHCRPKLRASSIQIGVLSYWRCCVSLCLLGRLKLNERRESKAVQNDRQQSSSNLQHPRPTSNTQLGPSIHRPSKHRPLVHQNWHQTSSYHACQTETLISEPKK